jgi:DNA modification methylase
VTIRILTGDALEVLRTLPDQSVHCVVTSPPYWGLRDYDVAGQLGKEATPEEYVTNVTTVFREVHRVLRNDGMCWVNLGDCYASSSPCSRRNQIGNGSLPKGTPRPSRRGGGLKEKDLVGVPWLVAFALRADGWHLRQDNIWNKPSCMPESATDRTTRSHEYVFMLTKGDRFGRGGHREGHQNA